MLRPTVRRADESDAEALAPALALVGAATFLESYALSLPGPDLVRHCAKAHTPEVYAGWLRAPACAVWTVVAGDEMVVGYAVLAPSDLPERREGDLELRRIYVLTRFQGGGLGRALVETVAQEARRRGAARLTLGVYGENQAALAFYGRMGFAPIGTREFTVGAKVCADYVLGMDL